MGDQIKYTIDSKQRQQAEEKKLEKLSDYQAI